MKVRFAYWLAFLFIAALHTGPALADDVKFSKQQLDQMLAPIALYPDDLLSNVLMGSTYPLDIVEAQRWRSEPENVKLEGDALTDAVKSKDWDPSIKALLLFPDVLKTMSDQLDWTQNLGTAFTNQQAEVMDEVQFLRSKASASGHLKNNSQQTIKQDGDTYVIEPADPDVVYVPTYQPDVVYGPWWYPDYPPYYWGYPGAVFNNGYWWGAAGFAIAGGIWGWNRWDWRRHDIHVDVNRWNRINGRHNHISSDQWKHNPRHRGSMRPHNNAAGDATRRRELNKDLRRTDGNVNRSKIAPANVDRKRGGGDPARFRHKRQSQGQNRGAGNSFKARPHRAAGNGGGHARKFNAPKRGHGGGRGGGHRGRRR
ncbi:DUF3300 domain-containing protein [Hyphomicrobium sp.]|uniref:DUF3300 domain-containing protein n=1 Tax=Hyphomicrobium sp. TaxID=82 RepID=UPI0035641B5C